MKEFDLIILDATFADVNVFSVITAYRNSGGDVPILVTTTRDSAERGIIALDCGADDYLVTPFTTVEFQARIRALLRRCISQKSSLLSFGPLWLDTKTRTAWLDVAHLDLTPRERSVLEVLLKNPERIVSKDQIASHIFSIETDINPTAIETYVYRLRRKTQHPEVEIKTIYGEGYILHFKPDVEASNRAAN